MKDCPKCGVQHNKNGTYCSRQCANSRTWTEDINKKRRESVNRYYENNSHPLKGKLGRKHSEEDKDLIRQKVIEYWDRVGRKTPTYKAAQNKFNVHNYRARKIVATCPTADLKLIKLIMERCPPGFEVDHIVSMTNGGKHHEDNLQYLPAMENRRKNNKDVYDESLVIRWQDVIK